MQIRKNLIESATLIFINNEKYKTSEKLSKTKKYSREYFFRKAEEQTYKKIEKEIKKNILELEKK